jgi:site-specific DNA-methyltransferase (adenine-specific)
MTDLRHGDYRDVLSDVYPDAVIVDPPYSARTHAGSDPSVPGRRRVDYTHWTHADILACTAWMHRRVRGWIVVVTDDLSIHLWRTALGGGTLHSRDGVPYYDFAALPYVAVGSRVRICGDGPSCWVTHIVTARPRCQPYASWGTLPGAYILPRGLPQYDREQPHIGGKPLWLMRALIRDYTRPGDLVCDPTAGAGTTLLAAAIEGRRAVGAEMDRDTYTAARARLAEGYTPSLLGRRQTHEQLGLLGED